MKVKRILVLGLTAAFPFNMGVLAMNSTSEPDATITSPHRMVLVEHATEPAPVGPEITASFAPVEAEPAEGSYDDILTLEGIELKLKAVSSSPAGTRSGITPNEVKFLCSKVMPILEKEPTLLRLPAPMAVFGDIHGDYQSLMRFLQLSEGTPRLFLGDYIDRGKNSIETMCMLMLLKIIKPNENFLLRGNHEFVAMSANGETSLRAECISAFDQSEGDCVWGDFNDVFDFLPLAGVVGSKIFCVHGGISPNFDSQTRDIGGHPERLHSLEEIGQITRPFTMLDVSLQETPEDVIVTNLLWSDPDSADDSIFSVLEFRPNSVRGLGFRFNSAAVSRFLSENGLTLVVRAHELCLDGFAYPFEKHVAEDPNKGGCLTVFSSPDYSNWYNDGAILIINEDFTTRFIIIPSKKPRKYW